MSRYFSKLAKRTGIAASSAGKMRRQTARVNIRPAFQPNIPEMTVHAHVPQPGNLKGEDQQSRDMPEGDNQPHETSSETTAVKNDEPGNVSLIEKRQYIASPSKRAPSQNHFDKNEMANSLSRPKSERQHIRKEKTIEVETISAESESQGARESGDDPFFDPMPYTRIKETPSTSLAAIESSEKTPPHGGIRTIHIVSERGRTAEMKLEKAESPAHDNSVDIHIGTISFEVHQAPEKKTVTDPPPPAPRPVVIQQTHSPKTPRLSR
jgi:hypothetical protein